MNNVDNGRDCCRDYINLYGYECNRIASLAQFAELSII